jgi:hypothetical protein
MKLEVPISPSLPLDLVYGVVVPKLSAAMTTPSLNFAASTEVPVTIGL